MVSNRAGLQLTVKKVILVVDDEIINREILRSFLRDEYEVLQAADGEEALEQMRRHSDILALVLLDLIMPGISGMVLLKTMSEDGELSRIPVVVMTSDQEAEVACLELGALDFIPKPYPRRDIVLARVHRTIELSEDRRIIRNTERDHLTGLYNREYFYSYAESFDQHHKGTAMDAIVVDVNHFHMLNDRYGRAYSDQVLKRLGERLRENARASGGIACRREADTFMVYCPHREDHREILEYAQGTLLDEESREIRCRLRMGVYANVDKSMDMEQRFDRAKMAADAVRSNYTQNISFYDQKLHEKELFSEQLVEEFETALRERQFKVFYQPKFDIRPEQYVLTSAEALIRWQHPKMGLISPGIFIPLFESNGMIQQLDNYVWREAAAQVRQWKSEYGISVPVSVNVSRVDMYDPNLVSTFEGLLRENSLEPEELLLEITESAYTDDADFIIKTVNNLRDLGLKVEMDDFGTGYSSLGMISRLPIDALKLDMIFIRSAFSGQGDVRMLELIIDIADYLSVPVIAEGVETKEQVNALKTMGCDIVQGFYFSKPIPPEAFAAFVAEKKKVLEEQEGSGAPSQRGRNGLPFSSAMADGFESLYYVDVDTGYYMEFGTRSWHESLHLQKSGENFFEDLERDVAMVIFPEDQEKILAAFDRKTLLARLREEGEVTAAYRLLIEGEAKPYQLKAARGKNADDRHIVIGVSRLETKENPGAKEGHVRMEGVDLSDIASMVSGKYDTLYYVDSATDAYTVFQSENALEELMIGGEGLRFFEEFREGLLEKVYAGDRERVAEAFTREAFLEAMSARGAYSLECRMLVNREVYTYRLSGFYPEGHDPGGFAVGVRSGKMGFGCTSPEMADKMTLTYARIAQTLSQDYFTVYSINRLTHAYIEYSMEGQDHRLYPVAGGDDFFTDCRGQIPERIIASDRARVMEAFEEKNLLKAVADKQVFSIQYQVLVNGLPMYVSVKAMQLLDDPEHIVIGMSNIDAQVQREKAYEEALERSMTYARLAQALAADYFSIYYVDTVTDYFTEFTAHDAYEDLGIEKEGEDFFNLSRKNILRVLYPEDQPGFLQSFTKENVLREIRENGNYTITYRLMINAVPTYVSLKATAMKDREGRHIVVGVNNIHAQMQRNMETVTYAHIAEALAGDYFSIYYVDMDTEKFMEYSAREEYEVLGIEKSGEHFFDTSRTNVLRVMYPEDQKGFLEVFTKENLARELEKNGSFTMNYRLVFNGKTTWVSMKAMRMMNAKDGHIVIGVNNIENQMQRQLEYEKAREQSLTYARIAQALSKDYYSIYLVNIENDEFIEYSSNAEYQELQVEQSGTSFFEDCRRNVIRLVHPDDLKKALSVWEKDSLMEEIRDGKPYSVTYRLMFDDNPVYINCKVIRLKDEEVNQYIIIGISNVDAQMKRELSYAEDLKRARNAALRDSLTGVKSRTAYTEAVRVIDEKIRSGSQGEFAVAVCDVNELKAVNDEKGHTAGDEHIKTACSSICVHFKHSPVYRVGGDEFVVILQGRDYLQRAELYEKFRKLNAGNRDEGGVVVACGMSDYDPPRDQNLKAVFGRADEAMQEDKQQLKR